MKKIIFATAFLVALAVSSFGKDVDTKLLKELNCALKASPTVQWSKTENYTKAAFNYNGKEVAAFYAQETEELIGFTFNVEVEDWNAAFLNAIREKYPDWGIIEAVMFIDAKADSDYFYHIRKDNNDLAIKVKTLKNGKTKIFSRIQF